MTPSGRRFSRGAFLGSAAAFAGCTTLRGGGGRRNRGTIPGTLRYADGEGISGLNDHLYAQLSVDFLCDLSQGFLMRYDAHDRPYGDLALAVPSLANGGIAKDGKTIAFRLRRGVRWHDGAPFTAEDVVFSVHATANPANNDLFHSNLSVIADVDRRGDDEVVFRLKRPYAPFTDLFFSSDASCILPKHLLASLPSIERAAYNGLPVGLGPFVVKQWRRGDSVEMTANEHFHGGRPRLDKIVYRIMTDWNTIQNEFLTGGLDLAILAPANAYLRATAAPGFHGVTTPGGSFTQFSFNLAHPAIRDLAVRRALRFATNRPLLARKVMRGLADLQESPIGGQSPHRDGNIRAVPYDPKAAVALLEAAGWRLGGDGVRAKGDERLSFDLVLPSGVPERDAIAAIVQSDWAKIGVQAVVKHFSATTLYDTYGDGGILQRGKYDIEQSHQGYGIYGDVSAIFSCDTKPPGANTTRYCDPAFDREIGAFNAAYDPSRSQRLADSYQQRLVDDVPAIVLFIGRDLSIVSDDLKGYVPRATFDGSERWSI